MNTYNAVEKKGLCVKCGMCSSTCSRNAIINTYDEDKGFYRIQLLKDRCNQCGLCMKVCPVLCNFDKASVSITGPYQRLLLGHAADTKIRRYATSGGCVNALIRYLITEEKVSNVLMVCEHGKEKTGTNVIIVNRQNINLLGDSPRKFASRYVSYPVLSGLKQIKSEKNIAVVGTPCQIMALTNYNRIFRNKKIFKIGIACSGGTSYKASEYLLKRRKLQGGTIYYRGDGWPGNNSIISGKRTYNEKHLESLFSQLYKSQVFRNPACLQCNDQFAEDSDISFFDFWNSKEQQRERIGNSGIIVRSTNAAIYLEDMFRKNYIDVVGCISEKDVIKSQAWPVLLKKKRYYNKYYIAGYYRFAEFLFRSKFYAIIPEKGYQMLVSLFKKLIPNDM